MRYRRREREQDEDRKPDPRPRGNPRCVCGGTGLVTVTAREGEFRTSLGNVIAEGRDVAVACKCHVGDWINEHRSEEMRLPVFHAGMLSVKAIEEPLPTVGPMQPDSWD